MIGRRSLLLAGAALPASVSAYSQCVTDSMVVDACLGGVRRTVPQGMTLDLNFMSAPLDPRITFTRASTATYTDASGTIQTAAINAPRWDYDPVTHALRGLLIEEARTNYMQWSGDLSHAPWASAGGGASAAPTVTGNNAIAPDGTLTAARIVMPAVAAGSNNSFVYAASGGAAVQTVCSLWLRGAVGGEIVNLYYTNFATYYHVTATLTTSWQRFSVVASPTSGGWAFAVGTDMRDATQTPNSAQTFYAWGAQAEQGVFGPTSYIPTTSASVSRANDDCSISSANMTPWFASPGGTWFAEFIDNTPVPLTSTSPRILGAHSAAGITPLWATNSNIMAQFDGASVQTVNAITVGAISKGASNWAPGTGRICLNGGAIGSGAMSTGFASLATAGVGILGGNPGVVNESMTGYIRRVRYWPRVLSDAEMQQVTT